MLLTNYRKLWILGILSLTVFSCAEEEEFIVKQETLDQNIEAPLAVQTWCYISGPLEIETNNTYSYTANTNLSNIGYNWSVTNGSATIVGGNNTKTIQLQTPGSCSDIHLQAIMYGQETCSETIILTCTQSGGPEPCPTVANPVIQGDTYVCGGEHYSAVIVAGADGMTWEYDQTNLYLLNGGFNSSSITVQFKTGKTSGWVNVRSFTNCEGPNPQPNYKGMANSCP